MKRRKRLWTRASAMRAERRAWLLLKRSVGPEQIAVRATHWLACMQVVESIELASQLQLLEEEHTTRG